MTKPARAPWQFGTPGATRFGPFAIRWGQAGPPAAPLVVLLHGIYAGAHGYEWRALAPLLTDRARVRIPDLLGAGASDRPPLAYTPEIVLAGIEAIIEAAGPECHIVASSLTGAYALRAAADGAKMASLTLITPTGLGRTREAERTQRSHRLFDLLRSTPLGVAFVHLLTSKPSVSWFQRHKTYRDPDVLTDDELIETRLVGRLPGAQHLQLAFVLDRLSIDVAPTVVRRLRPMVVWGSGQRFVDNRELDAWARAGAHTVDVSSGLPHVEQAAAVADLIRGHLGETAPTTRP